MATSRYGILKDGPQDWVDGINNWESCNQGLSDPGWYNGYPDGGRGSLSDTVNRMLSLDYFDCWEHFASTKWSPEVNAKGFMSLEYIHNVLHVGPSVLFDPEVIQNTDSCRICQVDSSWPTATLIKALKGT